MNSEQKSIHIYRKTTIGTTLDSTLRELAEKNELDETKRKKIFNIFDQVH